MLMAKYLDKYYIFIIPILILGIYFGFSSYGLCLAVIALRLFYTNKDTLGVFLLMYGGPLGGMTRLVYPILPVYGFLLTMIGFLLLWDEMLDLLKNNLKALGLLAITLISLASE